MKLSILIKYGEYLPITKKTPIFTLGECDTPLVKSRWIANEVGLKDLYFKLEGCNPTGSFKDRGMIMAIAKAVEEGSKTIMCASTGNTSASAAAYGAHCDLQTVVLVPSGNIALGKLAQAVTYGAKVIAIKGNFDQALKLAQVLTGIHPITLVNSVNPYRIEGQKTGAFEIIDVLGDAPDFLFIPVGNAGNITAYWKGFNEYYKAAKSKKLPKMMGFQAAGAAPIVLGHIVEKPETIATAIKIGNPASWKQAEAARDQSGGVIQSVTDEEILKAYKLLTTKEGVFGEPGSAASVAGLIKLSQNGYNLRGKTAVCIITGNGLKDPDTALKNAKPPLELIPDLKIIEQALGLK
ncbi:MAG: threonine synthase [Chloroflexi bacterium]|nr:threonine synthase [Chloroflexota bacterium]